MCTPDNYKHLWLEPTHHARYVDPHDKNYELDLWHKWYLPPDGVEGKIVVDMGAGCGETAQFYLLHGAKQDRKSTRLNSSHRTISYAVFCLKKKNIQHADYSQTL